MNTALDDATAVTLGLRFRHDYMSPGYVAGLRALLADLEARPSIAQEVADELGIPLPDCAKESR